MPKAICSIAFYSFIRSPPSCKKNYWNCVVFIRGISCLGIKTQSFVCLLKNETHTHNRVSKNVLFNTEVWSTKANRNFTSPSNASSSRPTEDSRTHCKIVDNASSSIMKRIKNLNHQQRILEQSLSSNNKDDAYNLNTKNQSQCESQSESRKESQDKNNSRNWYINVARCTSVEMDEDLLSDVDNSEDSTDEYETHCNTRKRTEQMDSVKKKLLVHYMLEHDKVEENHLSTTKSEQSPLQKALAEASQKKNKNETINNLAIKKRVGYDASFDNTLTRVQEKKSNCIIIANLTSSVKQKEHSNSQLSSVSETSVKKAVPDNTLLIRDSPALSRMRQNMLGITCEASTHSHLSGISGELIELESSLTPLNEHIIEKDAFLHRLQQTLNLTFESCVVSPFGSIVNGFWTPYSDVDICLQIPACSTRTAQIKVLRRVAAELHGISTHYIELRFGAKVPIIHWAPKQPGTQVACDISVNNTLAIVNSKLIGAYVNVDRRLRTLGYAVKHWAKNRGINDRSKGTVSSFALILMLIHFLRHLEVPIMPFLQDIAISRNYSPIYLSGFDCRYCTNMQEIQEELHYLRNGKPPNDESCGQLLLKFFKYYGYEYKYGIIAIQDLSKYVSNVDEQSCYLFVNNPFEMGKDVANVVANQYLRIRQEFRRAYTMLNQGESFASVCKSENRLNNFFGNH